MKTTIKEPVYTHRLEGIIDIEDKIKAWSLATPEERKKYGMKQLILKNARSQLTQITDPKRRAEIAKKLNEIREEQ